mgnify:CR=1 FL=1
MAGGTIAPVGGRAVRRPATGPTVLLLVAAACSVVVAPDVGTPELSVVLTTEPVFGGVLRRIDRLQLEVAVPGRPVRDTVLAVQVTGGALRARTVLHPSEGEPGTVVHVTLLEGTQPRFRAQARLDAESGWPFEAEMELEPEAVLSVWPGSWQLLPGESVLLEDMARIVFTDGEAVVSDRVTWTWSDPEIVELTQTAIIARSPGSSLGTAAWNGQRGNTLVTVEPAGQLTVSDSMPRVYLADDETLSFDVEVTNTIPGEIFAVEASVPAAYPWLSATLADDAVPTTLTVRVDGTLVPSGGEVGIVELRPAGGERVTTVSVDARLDPTVGVETRIWERFCMFGDSIGVSPPGSVGCVRMEARAWNEGTERRLVLAVQNLHGSLGDSLDTALDFEVHGVGLAVVGVTDVPSLLLVRAAGSVATSGTPRWTPSPYDGAFSVRSMRHTSIVGCTPTSIASATYGTCAASGFTGSVRMDFAVPDTTWSLASAVAIMDPYMTGYEISACTDLPPGACTTVR